MSPNDFVPGVQRLQNLIGRSALLLAIRVSGVVMSFFMFSALAKSMGAVEFGMFALAFSTVQLLIPLLSMARREVVERFIPRLLALGDETGARGLVSEGWHQISVNMVLFAALLSVMLALTWAFGIAPSREEIFLLASSTLLLFVMMSAEYGFHILRGYGRIVGAALPRDVIWRSLVISVAASMWAMNASMSAWVGLLMMAALLIVVIFVQRRMEPVLRRDKGLPRSSLPADAVRAVRALWLPNTLNSAFPNLATIVIGFVLSPTESGAFFIAVRVANLLKLPLLAGRAIAINEISSLHALDRGKELQKKVGLLTGINFFVSFIGFLFVVFFGKYGLQFFDAHYADKASLLILLSVAPLLNSLFGTIGETLQVYGHEKAFAVIITTSNGIALLLLFGATAIWGTTGAAIAAILQVLLWNCALWCFLRSRSLPDVSVFGFLNRGRDI